MNSETELKGLGAEDFTFFLQFADRDKLVDAATTLKHEVAELERKRKRLALLESFLYPEAPPSKQGLPPSVEGNLPPPIDSSTTINDPPPQVPDNEKKEEPDPPATKEKRTRQTRIVGDALEVRNNFIRKQNEDADNWLYRSDYEQRFLEAKWLKSEANLREVVRQFLRQARAKNVIIEQTLYTITPTKKVQPTYIYGLPEFLDPENREKYQAKLREKAKELHLFLTEQDALAYKDSAPHNNQMSIDA